MIPALQKFFPRDERELFRNSAVASIVLHIALFGAFYLKHLILPGFDRDLMEIDLTQPFRIGGNPLLKPGGGTTDKPVRTPSVPGKTPEGPSDKSAKPKDWILPGPNTPVEKPTPDAAPPVSHPGGIEGATGEGYQGTGGGFGGGDGEGGGLAISRYPQLLNVDEIMRLLRRNYPSAERAAGREGDVFLDLHLDAAGKVLRAEVAGSAGASFDAVALRVSHKMLFSPAMVQTQAVAAKIRQRIQFKLEDE